MSSCFLTFYKTIEFQQDPVCDDRKPGVYLLPHGWSVHLPIQHFHDVAILDLTPQLYPDGLRYPVVHWLWSWVQCYS